MTPVRFSRLVSTRSSAGGDAGADLDVSGPAPSVGAGNGAPMDQPRYTAPSERGTSRRQQQVDEAVDSWIGRLLELGGESALADITQLGGASIDLTAAHPSGIAQLFAGRSTLLSNLVREGSALASARRRARTVLARADELAQRFGVAPTYLAIGIASWTSLEPRAAVASSEGSPLEPDGANTGDDVDATEIGTGAFTEGTVSAVRRTVRAPILLRPVRLTTGTESDVDVVLEPTVEVNPVLVRALRAAGSTLDAIELARGTMTEHGFAPRAALRRLREEGEAALTNFRYAEHLVLGPFVHPGQVLVEDLELQRRGLGDHDVVAALAGDPGARTTVRRALPPFVPGDRNPAHERGVGDLDPAQQHALDAVASGAHLFIDAPPGADVPGTLAAIVADAAASGRHVLYVSGTRRAGQGLREAMVGVGLDGLLLDLSADARWRPAAGARLAGGADVEAPPLDESRVARTRGELEDARAQIAGYISTLHARRPAWGVSAYDALQALAALTAGHAGPRTKVRLDAATVRALSADRATAAASLTRAAQLGAFALRPEDTPWFGAALTDSAEAQEAVDVVRRLADRSLPALRRRVADVAAQTGMQPADRLRTWGDQLALVEGMHAALDVFLPDVFRAPVADLVAATGSREWRAANGVEMGSLERRRLRREARELVRPGRGVPNLHQALVDVRSQLDAWRGYAGSVEPPVLPDGLWEAREEYEAVLSDVAVLEPVLAPTPQGGDLAGWRLVDLEARMNRLVEDADALRELPERTRLMAELRRLGLAPLLADLAERGVTADTAAAELELAWWSSVFEEILRAEPTLAEYDGETLSALADRVRELDAAQLATLPGPVLRAVAQRRRKLLLESSRDVRNVVRALADERIPHVQRAVEFLGPVAAALRPCWMVAPMQVPQLLETGRRVDLVVLDAVQHLPVEQAVSAIARADQVVVVGDSRRAALNGEGAPEGVVDALAAILPSVTLTADRVVREPALMAFLGEHGYGDVVRPVPTPETRSALRLDVVDGFGMPSPGSAVVESPQTEVDRVVDLVIEHALTRPEESLVVLTVGLRHADRVREAVRAAAADSPALAGFFSAKRPEPFAVLELDSAARVRRDAVLLSLGLGKTPHGRVMHRFGRLSDPDGAGLLIDAIDACRRRLTVVSCFAPGELDRWRLRTPGPLLLADLLEAAEAGGRLPASLPVEGEPDQLLVDLAERLRQRGLLVVPRYGVPGGVRIPLVLGDPARPEEMLLAVLTDGPDYAGQPSLRIRDRHDVQRLADRGWGVHTAFSTAVFLDPHAEVENVIASIRRLLVARRAGALELNASARSAEPTVPPTSETGRTDAVSASEHTTDARPPWAASVTSVADGEERSRAVAAGSVDAEFSEMAARYAEMEVALAEMEAEFDELPDDVVFGEIATTAQASDEAAYEEAVPAPGPMRESDDVPAFGHETAYHPAAGPTEALERAGDPAGAALIDEEENVAEASQEGVGVDATRGNAAPARPLAPEPLVVPILGPDELAGEALDAGDLEVQSLDVESIAGPAGPESIAGPAGQDAGPEGGDRSGEGPERGRDGRREAVLPDRAAEDTDLGWGSSGETQNSNDEALLRDRPPHWA